MAEKSYKNMCPEERAEKIVEKLESEFKIELPEEGDPFLTLVRTVLSQNTNRRNTSKAYNSLKKKYETPSDFAEADLEELKKLIKPAGLYNSKSKTLKELGQIILKKFDGELGKIFNKGSEKAREEFLGLPGVGPKTADCVLLFAGGFDVLPVDTHVDRTARRLGLASLDNSLEEVKKEVERVFPDDRLGKTHILLIELGREYCKARKPDCEGCPVEKFCPKVGVD